MAEARAVAMLIVVLMVAWAIGLFAICDRLEDIARAIRGEKEKVPRG